MFPEIPIWIPALFILTAVLTAWIFMRAYFRIIILWLLITWVVFQSILGLSGFYWDTSAMTPRFILLPVPPLCWVLWMLVSRKGRAITSQYDLRLLTFLHAVRFPVEIVLYGLFVYGALPEMLTFTGQNPDIIMGLTAPLTYWLCFKWWRDHPERSRRFLIIWNIAGILLLTNIVVRAILSVPTPFQQWGFDQPNIAVTHFPYVFLPALIVPIVYFAHFAALRLLLRR